MLLEASHLPQVHYRPSSMVFMGSLPSLSCQLVPKFDRHLPVVKEPALDQISLYPREPSGRHRWRSPWLQEEWYAGDA